MKDRFDRNSYRRLRMDNIHWLASKYSPELFGDRVDVNVTQTVDIEAALKEAMDQVKNPKKYLRMRVLGMLENVRSVAHLGFETNRATEDACIDALIDAGAKPEVMRAAYTAFVRQRRADRSASKAFDSFFTLLERALSEDE